MSKDLEAVCETLRLLHASDVKCRAPDLKIGLLTRAASKRHQKYTTQCRSIEALKQMLASARLVANDDFVTRLLDGDTGAWYEVLRADTTYIDTQLQLESDVAARQYGTLKTQLTNYLLIHEASHTTKADRQRLFELMSRMHVWRVGNPQYEPSKHDHGEWADLFAHYIRTKESRVNSKIWRQWTDWTLSTRQAAPPNVDFYT